MDKDTWLNISKRVSKLKIKYKTYINSEDVLRIESDSKAEQNLLYPLLSDQYQVINSNHYTEEKRWQW